MTPDPSRTVATVDLEIGQAEIHHDAEGYWLTIGNGVVQTTAMIKPKHIALLFNAIMKDQNDRESVKAMLHPSTKELTK